MHALHLQAFFLRESKDIKKVLSACARGLLKKGYTYPKYFKPLPSQPHGAVLKDHYLTVVSISVFL
ncbi:hypothetical protein CN907_00400 [Bacillus anthracis]|nr:hypothetical protein CN907_00400 [Bacillus anthracis]